MQPKTLYCPICFEKKTIKESDLLKIAEIFVHEFLCQHKHLDYTICWPRFYIEDILIDFLADLKEKENWFRIHEAKYILKGNREKAKLCNAFIGLMKIIITDFKKMGKNLRNS